MSKVESGPFVGLKLCSSGSWGGHGARLVGTYEKELACVIESIPVLGINHILDVGCADGYYSCGFAFKYSTVSVTAYDLSRRARWCTYSALLSNKLLDRVSIKTYFDVKNYHSRVDQRELLFLDCEGFEAEIITTQTVHKFINAAILVECHDFVVPNITASLSLILQDSHELQLMQSRDRTMDDVPENMQNRESILSDIQEGRPNTMTWILAIPKSWTTAA
jgi:hypothetical protein